MRRVWQPKELKLQFEKEKLKKDLKSTIDSKFFWYGHPLCIYDGSRVSTIFDTIPGKS